MVRLIRIGVVGLGQFFEPVFRGDRPERELVPCALPSDGERAGGGLAERT